MLFVYVFVLRSSSNLLRFVPDGKMHLWETWQNGIRGRKKSSWSLANSEKVYPKIHQSGHLFGRVLWEIGNGDDIFNNAQNLDPKFWHAQQFFLWEPQRPAKPPRGILRFDWLVYFCVFSLSIAITRQCLEMHAFGSSGHPAPFKAISAIGYWALS